MFSKLQNSNGAALPHVGYCHSGLKSISTKWVRFRDGLIQLTKVHHHTVIIYMSFHTYYWPKREKIHAHCVIHMAEKCQWWLLNVLVLEWMHIKVVITINVNKSFSIWVLLTFWARKFFVGIAGCLAVSLTSTH